MSHTTPAPPVNNTKYLRESDDPVLHAYADVIERNNALWECMKQIMEAGMDLTESKLREWNVEYRATPTEPLTTELRITLLQLYIPGKKP